MKTSKIIPNRTCISVFLHTVLHCFHWEHRQVEGVRSVYGGSLRYEEIGQILNWYVILKGENLSFHLNINLSATLKNLYNYTQPYMHICFSTHCIVLFPLRTPESWRSAKCTRRSLRYVNFEFGQFLDTLKSLRVHFALLQLAGVLSGNNAIQCVEKQICMYGWV